MTWEAGPQAAPDGPDIASAWGEHASSAEPTQRQHWDTIPEPFDLKVEYSRELFVSPEGDDANGTGSAENPFATLARAADMAQPGTRINLGSGLYPGLGSLRGLQGTAAQPIAIVARGDAVIDGGGRDLGLRLSDPRYVVLEGLRFRKTWPHGVNIDDGGSFDSPARYVILRNLHFQDIGDGGNNDCLKMSGVRDFWVLSSAFQDCDRGEAIDMVGCHDGVVTRNHFHDMPRHAVGTKGGSTRILIQGNRFRAVAGRSINAGGHTGAPYFRPLHSPYEAARIHMVANVFEQPGDAPVAFVGCQSCVFANNTIIAPRTRLARVLWENTDRAPPTSGYYLNNLVVTSSRLIEPATRIDIGDGTPAESFVFDSNLMFVPGASRELPSHVRSRWRKWGIAVTTGDPMLADLAGGDYRIEPESRAIASGRSVPGGVPADNDGQRYGSPPSVGAFRKP